MIFKTSKCIVGEGSVLQVVRDSGTVLKFLGGTGDRGAGVGDRGSGFWKLLTGSRGGAGADTRLDSMGFPAAR